MREIPKLCEVPWTYKIDYGKTHVGFDFNNIISQGCAWNSRIVPIKRFKKNHKNMFHSQNYCQSSNESFTWTRPMIKSNEVGRRGYVMAVSGLTMRRAACTTGSGSNLLPSLYRELLSSSQFMYLCEQSES